ncbi:MAG: helix-turn-helix transcriptional regulator [Coprococcus sp.]|nr:helix-turn-helix transcriptional regulator [Coprococcus sp.]
MKKAEPECEVCEVPHIHEELIRKASGHMPDAEVLKELADFFKVFGDTTRIRILCVLFQSEMCVCDLAEVLGMTQSAISHQLRVLKQMKLVKNRREGKTVFYSLADSHIQTIMDQGMEHISE